MSATSGPDIVSDGLVFYYDTGNSRDSYLGEPTTNIRASSGLNGSYAASGRTVDNSGTLTAPDGSTGWSSISSPGSNSDFRIAQFAYNSLSEGSTYSFSLELYNPGPNSLEIFVDGNAGQTGTTIPLGYSRWSYTYTVTKVGGGSWAIFFGAENKQANASYSPERLIYFKNYQVEEKPHITPFTTGTRSTTGSLLDISGQGVEIDLANVSFDSNAQMTFDGTDDKIHGIASVHSHLSSSAIEFVVTPETADKKMTVGGYRHNSGYSNPTIGMLWIESNNKFYASVITAAEVYRTVTSTTTITANQTYNVVLNKDTEAGTLQIYVNGVLEGTQTFDAATYAQWTSAGSYIGSDNIDLGKSFNTNAGQGWSGDFLEGKIHKFKLYSRTLTASEVQQNYDSLKTRFGLT